MGFVKWSFVRSSDCCEGHHWGEGVADFGWRIEDTFPMFGGSTTIQIQRKTRYRCQHDGCSGTKDEWNTVRRFRGDEFVDFLDEDGGDE